MENLYTATEAAEILKVHPVTVKNWHKQGKLKAVKLGEKWLRFPESEIERIMNIDDGYLRPACPICHSENLSWVLAAGNGMYCMECGTTYYLTVGSSRKELEYERPYAERREPVHVSRAQCQG